MLMKSANAMLLIEGGIVDTGGHHIKGLED